MRFLARSEFAPTIIRSGWKKSCTAKPSRQKFRQGNYIKFGCRVFAANNTFYSVAGIDGDGGLNCDYRISLKVVREFFGGALIYFMSASLVIGFGGVPTARITKSAAGMLSAKDVENRTFPLAVFFWKSSSSPSSKMVTFPDFNVLIFFRQYQGRRLRCPIRLSLHRSEADISGADNCYFHYKSP